MKQYKDDDIDKLSIYSKELAEDNIKKDLEIKTLTQEFNNFKTMIQNKIYSLTTKLLDVLHIPYNWHQANDPDFAIYKARQHLNKNKSRDDFER